MESRELRQVPREPVGQVLTYEGRSIALVDLGRDASEALRVSWPTARPFHSGGVVESAWMVPMLGAGSTAASSLLAGNVFLATANPATLMTIGTGVGSAVMGPTGIVAAAPFVAAHGALIPVLAPVMLFTTVSSVMMCARLDRVQRTLGRLDDAVESVRRFMDAEDYGRFEAAAEGIEGIRYQFEQRNRFDSPDDVKFTLAMVENNVKTLRAKYGCLVAGHIDSEDDAKSAVSHLNRFFLASLQDIQVDVLRLYLTLQNDPGFVEPCQSQLRKKIERYGKDFRQVLDDDLVGAFHRTLKGDLAGSKWSHLPHGLRRLFGGELAARVRNVRVIRKDFNSVQTRIMRWIDAFESATDESREQSIVFYREPDGERTLRAYHTRDVRLQQAAA